MPHAEVVFRTFQTPYGSYATTTSSSSGLPAPVEAGSVSGASPVVLTPAARAPSPPPQATNQPESPALHASSDPAGVAGFLHPSPPSPQPDSPPAPPDSPSSPLFSDFNLSIPERSHRTVGPTPPVRAERSCVHEDELSVERRNSAFSDRRAECLASELHEAQEMALSMQFRAEAAEASLIAACMPAAACAAGNPALDPLLMQALSNSGLEATQLSYAEHIHPVKRLKGSSLEGSMCIVTATRAGDVPPGLAEHAQLLKERAPREKYAFHSLPEFVSALLVAQRHNLRTIRRGTDADRQAAGTSHGGARQEPGAGQNVAAGV